MFTQIAIFVLSCVATVSFDDFDPHHVDAALRYVNSHRDQCRVDPPRILDADVSLEQCRTRAMLNYMPGWMVQNPDRVWLGARCAVHSPTDSIAGDR